MKFTKRQRSWIREAFFDAVWPHVVNADAEIPPMYRTFVSMLARRRRAAWRR